MELKPSPGRPVRRRRSAKLADVCSTVLGTSQRIEDDETTLEVDVGSDPMQGTLLERGIGWYLDPPEGAPQNPDIVPHVAGMAMVGLSYTVAGALVMSDGPLPFGDVVALGVLAVPDVIWYGVGYSLFA